MGAGMGMGMAAGSVFGSMANQMFEPMSGRHRKEESSVASPLSAPSGRFTQQSSVQQPTSESAEAYAREDPVETLAKLKRMLEAGLIDQEEYDIKKAEVLRRM